MSGIQMFKSQDAGETVATKTGHQFLLIITLIKDVFPTPVSPRMIILAKCIGTCSSLLPGVDLEDLPF